MLGLGLDKNTFLLMKVSDCDLPASWESGVDVTVHQVRQARQQHTEENSDGVEDNCDRDGKDDEYTQAHNDYDYDYGVGEVAAH